MRIAVLLTCFNRKEKTVQCLNSLFQILDCDVYLVDDGSSDGTAEIIKQRFPKVRIIQGDGNLFWNRGMQFAWSEAAKKDYDFYIWLNDDSILYENCFLELFECSALQDDKAVISGIIESEGGITLYGGTGEKRHLLKPNGIMQSIYHMNGNIVLVPRYVYDILGGLDTYYHHDLGDVDYGLRAKAKGISVLTTRIAVAQGEFNPLKRERLNKTNIRNRFKRLYSPLGSNPRINFYFRKRHKSVSNAVLYYLFQHFLNIIPDWLNQKLFKNKYQ